MPRLLDGWAYTKRSGWLFCRSGAVFSVASEDAIRWAFSEDPGQLALHFRQVDVPLVPLLAAIANRHLAADLAWIRREELAEKETPCPESHL